MSHMYITDQLRDEADKDSFKLTRVFSAQDQKQVKRQGCTTLVAKLCLQMGYKARFFRPFGVGAQCQELTYREMLSVKQETESRQGLPEPLAVHRTEREMWRQYMVDGMTELVASVQRIGLGSAVELSFNFGRESSSSSLMDSRRRGLHDRIAGVPYKHSC